MVKYPVSGILFKLFSHFNYKNSSGLYPGGVHFTIKGNKNMSNKVCY